MDSLRLVETVLRCYPARWQHRHGEEAAELAALLIRDGTPAGAVAWSYLFGAARGGVPPRAPGRGGQHERAARARALPACLARARSGRDSRPEPPAGDHLGGRA